MASPYFQNINLQKQDFSALQAGGRAMGEAYASGFRAIGQIGSAYFERKNMERKAQEIVKTPQGQNMLVANGMSKEEVASMAEDPKKANKMMYDIINDAGGIEKFNSQMKDFQQTEMQQKQFAQQTKQHNQTIAKNNYLLDELEKKERLSKLQNDYFTHLNSDNKDGTKRMLSDDPTGGFESNDPLAPQVIRETNKKLSLGRYSPERVSEAEQSFYRKDNPDDLESPYLRQTNFFSQGQLQEELNKFYKTDRGRAMPQEQRNALETRLKSTIDGAGGQDTVAEIFEKRINNSGFGEFKEAMSGNIGTMGRFTAMLDTALIEVDKNEDGSPIYDVINPTAGSVALVQLAKLAQGAGVLSDKDVDRISGSSRYKDSWNRWISGKIGDERTLTQEMYDSSPYYKNSINPRTGEPWKVDEKVIVGGSQPSATDLQMFRDIAQSLDKRSNEFAKEIIPDIYKQVRAKYGGFTVDELNTQTDLHNYMPNGIVDLSPMANVTESDKSNIQNLFMKGFTKKEIENIVTKNSIDAGTWNDDTDKPALKSAIEQVDKNVPPEFRNQNPVENPFPDPPDYDPPVNINNLDFGMGDPPNPNQNRKVAKQKLKERLREELFEGIGGRPSIEDADGGRNILSIGAGAIAGKAGINMLNSSATNATLKGMGSSAGQFNSQLKAISNATPNQLKATAKFHGLDPNSKGLAKQLKKKLVENVKDATKQRLMQRGLGKKIVEKVLGTAFVVSTAGLGGMAMMANDIISMSQENGKIEREELGKMLTKYKKGSKERTMIQEMINSLNYESGDFKEYQSRATKGRFRSDGVYEPAIYTGSGDRAFDYETYRATIEGI
jgi:hypothetical protein